MSLRILRILWRKVSLRVCFFDVRGRLEGGIGMLGGWGGAQLRFFREMGVR